MTGARRNLVPHIASAAGVTDVGVRNPALDRDATAMPEDLIGLEAEIERRWDAVERLCAGFAETFVHGDINLRTRRDRVAPQIQVFDWEMAGWGLPAADLERVDLEQRPSEIGRLFRTLVSIEWASRWLGSEWISAPLDELRTYRDRLARSVIDGAMPW